MSRAAQIIFFIETPFGERNYKRYGIEVLQKNGFDVEVWDFTPFLRPQIHRDVKVPDPIQFPGHKQFLNKQEALAAISELAPDCFVVALIAYQYGSISIYRALSSVRAGYCSVVTNAIPVMSAVTDLKSKWVQVRRSKLPKLMKALLSRIPFCFLGIRPATVLLAGGEQSFRRVSNRPISRETTVLWAHTRDYDLYLDEKDRPVHPDTKMGVFLDEYYPFHTDFKTWGYPHPCVPEKYYPSLCAFFDNLERTYGVRIVVAAHPQMRSEDDGFFRGRPVFRGKTVELVREAGFVIAHSSSALNFAVLFHKPVLFITTDELRRDRRAACSIQGTAAWLNKVPINVDAPLCLDWEKELAVDRDAYARYREAYIKRNDSPEQNTWQILADYLKASEA